MDLDFTSCSCLVEDVEPSTADRVMVANMCLRIRSPNRTGVSASQANPEVVCGVSRALGHDALHGDVPSRDATTSLEFIQSSILGSPPVLGGQRKDAAGVRFVATQGRHGLR